jgi:citrate lyase subunit beta/citryl-CoA lyase
MRVERSVLSIPASNWRMIEKGIRSAADVAFLDLEDAVASDAKMESRQNVVRALRELDWGAKPPAYRMNALDTPFFYRDLVDIVEETGEKLALIIVPKVGRAEELVVVDVLLTQIEANVGLEPGRIKLEAQIESAEGLLAVERIARSTGRLQALVFGPGDYAASVHMPMSSIGAMDEWDDRYPGHRFHYPMHRIAVAARAAGLLAIDGPVANVRDLDGYRQSSLIARSLGYDGKWCIHPNQIPIANEVFSPTEKELAWAKRVVDAYREAVAAGRGVLTVDDKMIDAASIKLAERTIELAQHVARTS